MRQDRKREPDAGHHYFSELFSHVRQVGRHDWNGGNRSGGIEKIYELEIVVIPNNKPLIRVEYPDVVYRTEREKFNAVSEEIKEYHLRGQPVLVGTIAIEKSERLSALLRKSGVLPGRLQELLKAAGLEGPKLQKWAQQLAERHENAVKWLIRAGVTASAAQKTLGQRAFQPL